nr:D-alanine--D-alanine ligase family [Tanacetum cinerariifolium]
YDEFVITGLVCFYAKCGRLDDASKLFDEMPHKNAVSWGAILAGYMELGKFLEAVEVFRRFLGMGLRPDSFTIVRVLSACAKLGDLRSMPEKDAVTWGAMIQGYASNGKPKEALDVFYRMKNDNIKPDCYTIVGVLSACSSLGALELGEWARTLVDKNEFLYNPVVGTALIDMYAKCGQMAGAWRVFKEMKEKDLINLVTAGDLPRFVMVSYEQFDVVGDGACLKRYTDPAVYKVEASTYAIERADKQRDKKIRQMKTTKYGGIQALFEKSKVPFVGTRSKECRTAFDKYDASLELQRQGFITVPNFVLQGNELDESGLLRWFSDNKLDVNSGKVVVKPTRAGSSIGVTVAYGVTDSLNKVRGIISEGIDDKVIIEIFLEGGREFTAIVLDVGSDFDCQPVVFLPTEVELQSSDSADTSEKDAIFNYRRKYLPTQQVVYHTPPRFPLDVIQKIREGASILFKNLGLRDFARIDGWFLPASAKLSSSEANDFGRTESGVVIFTDINLISGMEQTSFLFQQGSK